MLNECQNSKSPKAPCLGTNFTHWQLLLSFRKIPHVSTTGRPWRITLYFSLSLPVSSSAATTISMLMCFGPHISANDKRIGLRRPEFHQFPTKSSVSSTISTIRVLGVPKYVPSTSNQPMSTSTLIVSRGFMVNDTRLGTLAATASCLALRSGSQRESVQALWACRVALVHWGNVKSWLFYLCRHEPRT